MSLIFPLIPWETASVANASSVAVLTPSRHCQGGREGLGKGERELEKRGKGEGLGVAEGREKGRRGKGGKERELEKERGKVWGGKGARRGRRREGKEKEKGRLAKGGEGEGEGDGLVVSTVKVTGYWLGPIEIVVAGGIRKFRTGNEITPSGVLLSGGVKVAV
ncbi:MAG: hypothetical protein CM15mP38_3500 [Synechococcus sp.]|nr:MAG: hypothetical protein CM15mP38_3500 [Synechococcus sp.]